MQNQINCPYQQKCGSCQLLHLTYQETLNTKLAFVNKCFKQNGFNITVNKIIPSSINTSYRNKMILGYRLVNGKIISGFYEEGTHHIVDIDSCMMHTPLQNLILQSLKNIFQSLKLKPYDEDKKVGLIRYVLVREAYFTKEVLIVIVTSSDIFPARKELIKKIKALSPHIKTIIQNVNSRKTSIVLGDKERLLYGDGYISDLFDDLKFSLSAKSFYQINTLQTKNLYKEIKRLANLKNTDIIIDCYSGVGTIGMTLAKEVKEVISVENNKQAVQNAIKNAKTNKINNMTFICEDATIYLVSLAKTPIKLDCLIMDPPRTGSTVSFLEAINKILPPKIVYVSCDVTTLVRDLKYLKNNYQITNIECVDMFSWTKHIETIVLLTKKQIKKTP